MRQADSEPQLGGALNDRVLPRSRVRIGLSNIKCCQGEPHQLGGDDIGSGDGQWPALVLPDQQDKLRPEGEGDLGGSPGLRRS